ncbi:MAG: threonine-phosphate decarboxylase CobD [Thermoleophilia bacterium]|nr:threonine-phosphate decarboxylase CobD [Thermoleophilia bacterium]
MVTHGGNLRELSQIAGLPPEDLLDFSANLNPLGPPDWLAEVITAHLDELAHYPDPQCSDLVAALVSKHEVPAERIVPANGSSELIAWLPRVFEVGTAVIPVPSYTEYEAACRAAGLEVRRLLLGESLNFVMDFQRLAGSLRGGELVFLARPNNPTGQFFCAAEFLDLVSDFPSCWFVVDEAFVEFVEEEEQEETRGGQGFTKEREAIMRADLPNVVVLRSLTKLYAVPGLRLGFAVASSHVCDALRTAMPPWSVNVLAQAVGARAVLDDSYMAVTRKFVSQERRWLAERLAEIDGLRVFPSVANYILVKVEGGPAGLLGDELALRLLRHGIAIRTCGDFAGLGDQYFRVAVRTRSENEKLIKTLGALLGCQRLEAHHKHNQAHIEQAHIEQAHPGGLHIES